MSAKVFDEWVRCAAPADRFEYYRGSLATDRSRGTSRKKRPLLAGADAAYTAWERGLVLLVQQRVGDFDFAYIAERTSRPAA